MQNMVAPVSSGLKQEEKYQHIPRDRWEKWREKLNKKSAKSSDSLANDCITIDKKPIHSGVNSPRPPNFAQQNDAYAHTLFQTALLTNR